MPANNKAHKQRKTGTVSQKMVRDSENLNELQQQSHPATIMQGAGFDSSALSASDVLKLQRTLGNKAVGEFLAQKTQQQVNSQKASRDSGSNIKGAAQATVVQREVDRSSHYGLESTKAIDRDLAKKRAERLDREDDDGQIDINPKNRIEPIPEESTSTSMIGRETKMQELNKYIELYNDEPDAKLKHYMNQKKYLEKIMVIAQSWQGKGHKDSAENQKKQAQVERVSKIASQQLETHVLPNLRQEMNWAKSSKKDAPKVGGGKKAIMGSVGEIGASVGNTATKFSVESYAGAAPGVGVGLSAVGMVREGRKGYRAKKRQGVVDETIKGQEASGHSVSAEKMKTLKYMSKQNKRKATNDATASGLSASVAGTGVASLATLGAATPALITATVAKLLHSAYGPAKALVKKAQGLKGAERTEFANKIYEMVRAKDPEIIGILSSSEWHIIGKYFSLDEFTDPREQKKEAIIKVIMEKLKPRS